MGSIVERALLPWAQRVKMRMNLPVRLRWGEQGDSSLALGDFDEPRVEIHVRDAAALPMLIDPGLDTLGQAYVEGLIDVEGSVRDVLAVAHGMAASFDGSRDVATTWWPSSRRRVTNRPPTYPLAPSTTTRRCDGASCCVPLFSGSLTPVPPVL